VAIERDTLGRLCAAAGLNPKDTERIITGLASAWRARSAIPAAGGAAAGGASAPGTGAGAGASTQDEDARVLPVQRFEHLAWLGLEPAVLQALRPLVDVLPTRTPVNLNTAGREVLAAVLAVDAGTAERLVQARQQQAFERLEQVRALLPPGSPLESSRVSVGSQYFEVRGRLRLEDRVLEEASLVRRRGTAEVLAVHRLRRNLQATTE
jgi:general secretion pathway protein K